MTSTNPKLKDLVEAYQTSEEFRALTPKTQHTYGQYLKRLKPLHLKYASSISRADLYDVWDQLMTTPGAQAQVVKVTRRMFTWGLERGVIENGPTFDRLSYKHRSQPREPWTDAEIERYRAAAREYCERYNDYHYVIDSVEIALATGQRIGDICAMETRNWDGDTFRVKQQKTGAIVVFRPKGEFLSILESAKRNKLRFVLDIPPPYHGREPRLRYHTDAVREMADVSKTFHGLRKTVAVKLREAGASNAQIAALLGHKTTRMVEAYAQQASQVTLATDAAEILARLDNGAK